MTEELQTDGQETEVIDAGTIDEGVTDTPDDNPTETGEETTVVESKETPAETPPVENEQDGVQKKINKIHREKKEAEERAEAERKKREELEAELQKYQKTEIPDIPEIPDAFDPDFDDKMKQRDEIIKKHAEKSSQEQALAAQKAAEVTAANEAHRKTVEGYVKAFDARIDELKLDKESLAKAEEIVAKYIGHQPGVAEFLISDNVNGPLNVQYLSQNLEELEKISKMSPTHAAAYIATAVTSASQDLKPKQTKAPEPPYDPEGNRRKTDTHPAFNGAKFE